MLQDSSPNFENTWKFLDQRLAEASVIHKFLAKSEETTQNLQNAAVSVFTTVIKYELCPLQWITILFFFVFNLGKKYRRNTLNFGIRHLYFIS
jgi:hypothetical protein